MRKAETFADGEVIPLRLTASVIAMIDDLIACGLYGNSRTEVARALLQDALKGILAARKALTK